MPSSKRITGIASCVVGLGLLVYGAVVQNEIAIDAAVIAFWYGSAALWVVLWQRRYR